MKNVLTHYYRSALKDLASYPFCVAVVAFSVFSVIVACCIRFFDFYTYELSHQDDCDELSCKRDESLNYLTLYVKFVADLTANICFSSFPIFYNTFFLLSTFSIATTFSTVLASFSLNTRLGKFFDSNQYVILDNGERVKLGEKLYDQTKEDDSDAYIVNQGFLNSFPEASPDYSEIENSSCSNPGYQRLNVTPKKIYFDFFQTKKESVLEFLYTNSYKPEFKKVISSLVNIQIERENSFYHHLINEKIIEVNISVEEFLRDKKGYAHDQKVIYGYLTYNMNFANTETSMWLNPEMLKILGKIKNIQVRFWSSDNRKKLVPYFTDEEECNEFGNKIDFFVPTSKKIEKIKIFNLKKTVLKK